MKKQHNKEKKIEIPKINLPSARIFLLVNLQEFLSDLGSGRLVIFGAFFFFKYLQEKTVCIKFFS